MSQFTRSSGFIGLVLLFLAVQVTIFGSNSSSQDPAASSDKQTASQKKKVSKKKKRTIATVPYIVFSPAASSDTTTAPINVQSVEVTPATMSKNAPTSERTSRPGLIQPAVTATAGQLVISEFRVRGPNGMNDEFI